MRPFTRILTLVVAAIAIGCTPTSSKNPESAMPMTKSALPTVTYPQTRTVDHVDEYHGIQIADPYRWLEELDGDDTRAWIEAQNSVTDTILDALPDRDNFRQRIEKIWNYEKFGTPWQRGGKYFYFRNDGLQNQAVLYVRDGLDGEPRVLLDANTLSDDGTIAISSLKVSPNGRHMAYGLSSGGSDWQTWHVRDVDTGKDLDDLLEWVKFSGASWTKDGRGFYYSRYDEPKGEDQLKAVNQYQKLYYHVLGTDQSSDRLVYERPDQKEWGFSGNVTDDGRYLTIHVSKGTHPVNQLFYKDLSQPDTSFVELLTGFDAQYFVIGSQDNRLFIQTDNGAPRSRIIAIDLENPAADNWQTLVPEREDTIDGATILNQSFVVNYLHDASNKVRVFSLSGEEKGEISLPGIGSISGLTGLPDDTETFYSFTGFTTPGRVFRYDMATGQRELFAQPDVDFDSDAFETRQVFYRSKDGTKIPMFITHKKGLKKTANLPTILYGYGGFNISLTPSFSASRAAWMDMGGVYAVANLRGGGEYGEAWHDAGIIDKKQNVFDDFIAAAEYLIDDGYTSNKHLAIQGGSNGGLLVGAVSNQRPELFAVALPAVGVMDMLRFDQFTIGWAWRSDYGDPAKLDDFNALRAYSPLHNLKSGTDYPATLVTTADHDDRVFPAHSFKYAAALQQAHAGDDPVLIRIETRAGHGAGKPTSKAIEEAADVLAFAWAFIGS